jgi:predicted Zn-dependent protease
VLHLAGYAALLASCGLAFLLHRAVGVNRLVIALAGVMVLAATIMAAWRVTQPLTSGSTVSGDPAVSARTLDSAIAQAQAGHLPEAIEALRRLIAREPLNAPAWANLCGLELEAGRMAAAEATCRDAVTLSPSSWLAHYNACASALANQPEQAVAALTRALDLVQTDPRAGLSRAKLAERARADRMLRTLHGQPRFESLLRRP